MLQFSNEPLALTHIHLSYLSLEERIGFMMLPEKDLLKEGPWKLTPQDIPKFRQTIQLSLEKDYQKLIDNNVRIIQQPGDDATFILAHTIEEQQREIAALLANTAVTEAHKKELRDLNPEVSIENMVKLDALLNDINMELAKPRLPEKREDEPKIHLNLTELGLSRLPEALIDKFREYTQLSIDLSSNELTVLPDSLGNLTALKGLLLNDNRLLTIPDSLGNLTELQLLSIYSNLLQTLPDSLGNLTALKMLILNDNQLRTLPDSLGNLTALTGLILAGNFLQILPNSLGNLTKLKALFLSKNNLTTLPKSLSNLNSLLHFPLDRNPLKILPEDLRSILTQTKNEDLHSLLAPEQPLNTELLFDKLTAFIFTENQGKSIFEKISAFNLAQLEQLNDAIKKKRLGLDLNEAEKNILISTFSIDETLCETFITQCIKEHGNLFLSSQSSPIHFQGALFKSYQSLTQHVFDNVMAVFYTQIQEKINAQLKALKPAPTEPKRKKRKTTKPVDACSVSANTRSKMKGASKRDLVSLGEERLLKKSRVYTPHAKKEQRTSATEFSWLALQAMVKEVDIHQGLLLPREQLSDAASIEGLAVVRAFLNNPENTNNIEGLRALLISAPGEQMGMGMAVKQFKEVPVSKLYDNLFKALQDASPKGKIRKIM